MPVKSNNERTVDDQPLLLLTESGDMTSTGYTRGACVSDNCPFAHLGTLGYPTERKSKDDSTALFIEKRCQTYEQAQAESMVENLTPSHMRVLNSELYRAYTQFCEQNGEFVRSHRHLTQQMKKCGFKQMNSGGRYWEGIHLIDVTS